jgi:hypothetical protein
MALQRKNKHPALRLTRHPRVEGDANISSATSPPAYSDVAAQTEALCGVFSPPT